MKPKRLPRLRLYLQVCLSLQSAQQALRSRFPDVVAEVKRWWWPLGWFLPLRNPAFRFLGTGFVVGNSNQVVTNAHVRWLYRRTTKRKAGHCPVGFRGACAGAAGNERAAVPITILLRFEGPPMPALSLGDSAAARDGQDVAWTGFPLGGAMGITSVTHRGIISGDHAGWSAFGQQRAGARYPDAAQAIGRNLFGAPARHRVLPGNSGSPFYDASIPARSWHREYGFRERLEGKRHH